MDSESFQQLPSIAPLLAHSHQVLLAYLIGSVSRNEQRKDSDIDIVLIVDGIDGISYGELYSKFADALHTDSVDLRVIYPHETDPLFLFQIVKDGQVIYEKNEKERVKFETYAMKMYYDTQHIRDIYNNYLDKRFDNKTFAK